MFVFSSVGREAVPNIIDIMYFTMYAYHMTVM